MAENEVAHTRLTDELAMRFATGLFVIHPDVRPTKALLQSIVVLLQNWREMALKEVRR